jgi:hypothetical protein
MTSPPLPAPATFLPEQPEAQASDAVRAIYAQIRRVAGVPMVALIFRHLATLPGAMEWAWSVIGPPLAQGQLQRWAWAMEDKLDLAPALPVSPQALRYLGIAEEAVGEMARLSLAYGRANPVNLLALRLIALRLQEGGDAGGGGNAAAPMLAPSAAQLGASEPWQPPAALGPLLPMIDLHKAPPELMALLQSLSQRGQAVPDAAFVPSYYRQLASRPPLLALASLIVPPAFARIGTAAEQLRQQASVHAAELARLWPAPAPCPPELRQPMLAAVEVFTERIPEMIAVVALLQRTLGLKRSAV